MAPGGRPHPEDELPEDPDWAAGEDDEADDTGDDHEERDRARFASDTAFCPECGAETLDDADICPVCFSWIGGETSRQRPVERQVTHRVRTVIVLLLVCLMLSVALLYLAAALRWVRL